jgi:L-amino acid N-acyltransferase YncA
VTVRPATPDDAHGIATVSVETWRQTYRHILPATLLAGLDVDKRAARVRKVIADGGRYWIAEDAGRIVGFSTAGPNKEANVAADAELYAIYVLPEAHGRGLGKALLREAVAYVRSLGHRTMCVFAFAENSLARDFYLGTGARVHDESVYNLEGVDYPDRSYVWDSLDELALRLSQGAQTSSDHRP